MRRAALGLLLALSASTLCACQGGAPSDGGRGRERVRTPAPPPAGSPGGEPPAIVLRGHGRPRAPQGDASPPPAAGGVSWSREEPAPDVEVLDEEELAPGALPVVLGETAGLRVRGRAARVEGRWAIDVDLQNHTRHDWESVEVVAQGLAGRVAVDTVRARVRDLPRHGQGSVRLEGASAEVDRVRLALVDPIPPPGEDDVAWSEGRMRGSLEVVRVRLLRTREHALDAIVDLEGEPADPWAEAELEATFLDDQGVELTRGTARIVRGHGPPWVRRHIVGTARSTRAVGEVVIHTRGVW